MADWKNRLYLGGAWHRDVKSDCMCREVVADEPKSRAACCRRSAVTDTRTLPRRDRETFSRGLLCSSWPSFEQSTLAGPAMNQ